MAQNGQNGQKWPKSGYKGLVRKGQNGSKWPFWAILALLGHTGQSPTAPGAILGLREALPGQNGQNGQNGPKSPKWPFSGKTPFWAILAKMAILGVYGQKGVLRTHILAYRTPYWPKGGHSDPILAYRPKGGPTDPYTGIWEPPSSNRRTNGESSITKGTTC